MTCMAEYNLILVGRTGNGKSSTGNTILSCEQKDSGRAFIPRNANFSIDNDVIVQNIGNVLRRNVRVIDGTGIGDTEADSVLDSKSLQKVIRDKVFFNEPNTSTAIKLTAIVVVLKFGVRFTKQDVDSMQDIRRRFGENVLKDWGVIVMTYGDNFEKEGVSHFSSWCYAQVGAFRDLLQECGERCVLFNNSIRFKGAQEDQVGELFRFIDKLKDAQNYKPYTIHNLVTDLSENAGMLGAEEFETKRDPIKHATKNNNKRKSKKLNKTSPPPTEEEARRILEWTQEVDNFEKKNEGNKAKYKKEKERKEKSV